MSEDSKNWLITGCSSGFGELFVRQLRALGHNVIATGRNADTKLAHLASTGAKILELDVTSSPSEINATMANAWKMYPNGIDIVVNNAGYILSGAIEELTHEETEHVFKTNFHGPMNITRALLPKFRERGTGTLCFMSSQAGWHADPGASGYCATKFALEGAVECLSKELALVSPNLKVLLFEPGYFRTRAFANINHVPARVPAYEAFNQGARAVETSVVGHEPGDPAKAVSIMIDLVLGTGIAEGRTVPLRMPLGSDGWQRVRGRGESLIKICDEWETVARSTDFTEVAKQEGDLEV
ncbi:NAD(P)-binding protein [Xylariaceae sp. FL0255]|nr:NAD(P)-binding protein [Xylariaceae sp. FL0255]